MSFRYRDLSLANISLYTMTLRLLLRPGHSLKPYIRECCYGHASSHIPPAAGLPLHRPYTLYTVELHSQR